VGQHHALRRSRSAGGVDQYRDLSRAARLHRLRRCRLVEHADADIVQRSNAADRRFVACGMARGLFRDAGGEKHPSRSAVIADLVKLARRQPGIDDDGPRADPACSEKQASQRDTVLADNHHAVAGPDSKRLKRRRDLPDGLVQLAVAPRRGILDQCRLMGRVFRELIHHLMDSRRKARENFSDINCFRRFRQEDLPNARQAAERRPTRFEHYSSFLELVN